MNTGRNTLALLILGGSAFILSRGILDMVLVRGDSLTSGNPIMRVIFGSWRREVATWDVSGRVADGSDPFGPDGVYDKLSASALPKPQGVTGITGRS